MQFVIDNRFEKLLHSVHKEHFVLSTIFPTRPTEKFLRMSSYSDAPLGCNVFSLPLEIFRSSVVPFLFLKDVIKLDKATQCHQLRELLMQRLAGSIVENNNIHKRITNRAVDWLLRRNVFLTHISFHSEVVEDTVEELGSLAGCLRSVFFLSCTHLSVQCILSFVAQCRHLEVVNLMNVAVRSEQLFVEIPRMCPELREFSGNFSHISDATMISLAKHCPRLRKLLFRKNGAVTSAGLVALSQNCHELLYLHINGKNRIADNAVCSLAEHCTQLTSLTLEDCNGITDASIGVLATKCVSLTDLSLYGCSQISDVGVQHIALHCRNVTSLDLGCRKEVTDASIVTLAQYCTQIVTLNLYDCHLITDAALIAIAHNCPHLEQLICLRCYHITAESFIALVHYCPKFNSFSGQEHPSFHSSEGRVAVNQFRGFDRWKKGLHQLMLMPP